MYKKWQCGDRQNLEKVWTGWVLEKIKKATIRSFGWGKYMKKMSKEYNEFKKLKEKGGGGCGGKHSFDCNE